MEYELLFALEKKLIVFYISRGEIPGFFAAQKEEDRFYDEL